MTKLSKILLIICLSIICICRVVSSTFCNDYYAPQDYFTIQNFASIPSNVDFLYYTGNNSDYIKLTNVRLDRKLCTIRFGSYTLVDDSDYEYTYKFGTFYRGTTYYYMSTIYEKWSISRGINSDGSYDYIISLISFNCQINSDCIPYSLYSNDHVIGYSWGLNCSYSIIPNSIIARFRGCSTAWFWNNISDKISYDIDYSNQYYYNSYFAFPTNFSLFDYCNTNLYNSNTIQYYFTKKANFKYSLIDNNNLIFEKQFDYSYLDNYQSVNNNTSSSYTIFNNNYNYDHSYIKSVSCLCTYFNFDGGAYNNLLFPSSNLLNLLVSSSNFGIFNGDTPFYYFQSFNLKNYSSGSSIPIGSNSYYKTSEWYDIPTHLYNFFIYLIFDAPIVSNFTKLAMVIINFVVETFQFVIGLFNGVSNVFFISIFVGMLALIFLLKIIFGGKT